MFEVRITYPFDDGWESRNQMVRGVIKNFGIETGSGASQGERDHCIECETMEKATKLKASVEAFDQVKAVIREK